MTPEASPDVEGHRKILALEIGGTKLQAAVGSTDSTQLMGLTRRSINRLLGAEGILDQLSGIIPELCACHAVDEISIGFGGPVDSSRGLVIRSNQVEGWEDFSLARWCEKLTGRSCRLINDCDAAALAEATRGAGREVHSMFYVTVGTGIGGGLVVAGQLQGAGRAAVAEIGQLVPNLNDPETTVEDWSSGTGIEYRFAHFSKVEAANTKGKDSVQIIKVPQIAKIAEMGDRVANQCLEDAARALGWAIGQTVSLTASELIVIGGGVSLLAPSRFLEPVAQWARHFAYGPLQSEFRVVPAELGEEVVLHGAVVAAANLQ